MKNLIVKSHSQTAELWQDSQLIKTYQISTAANGLGCEEGSYCTPNGKLKVAEKIGERLPVGTIFKARVPTGICTFSSEEDLVLTRILWLEGAEDKNLNTLRRYIYLHGTNHEDKLGTPASHGCVRFSNNDILEIFDQLEVGSEVYIE